jgi:signal transduction histidine kinase
LGRCSFSWLAGLGAGGLGFLLASRALTPIGDIASRARTIAAGDIAARLPVFHHGDEIGRMTILLNEMLDRLHVMLEASVRFAADAAHELRSPLTAMQGRSTSRWGERTRRIPRHAGDAGPPPRCAT